MVDEQDLPLAVTSQVVQFEKAKDFSVIDLEGEEINLADYKGNVVILKFWTTTCPSCIREIPYLIELYEEYNEEGLEIIALALDRRESAVKNIMRQHGINYKVAMDSGAVADKYGPIRYVPTMYIINRYGDIVLNRVGPVEKSELEKMLKDLLLN